MSASSLSVNTILTAGTSIASGTAGLVAWSLPFDSIGIPAAVLFMALTGTAAGLLITPPAATSRARMYGLAFAYTVFAAAAAIVIGEIPGLTFFAKVAPATALLIALFAQTLVPVLREAVAERAKRSIGGAK